MKILAIVLFIITVTWTLIVAIRRDMRVNKLIKLSVVQKNTYKGRSDVYIGDTQIGVTVSPEVGVNLFTFIDNPIIKGSPFSFVTLNELKTKLYKLI